MPMMVIGQQREDVQKLLQKEKDLMTKVRDREGHLNDLLIQLERDKGHVLFEETVYDIAMREDSTAEKKKKGNVPSLHYNPLNY
jgi:hypothetical protein